MIMSGKTYEMAEFFGSTSLISRQAAKKLCEEIARLKVGNVTLDFKNVDFASRSFFDQLNSGISDLKLANKQIELINLSENLKELLKLVKNVAKSGIHITYKHLDGIKTTSF